MGERSANLPLPLDELGVAKASSLAMTGTSGFFLEPFLAAEETGAAEVVVFFLFALLVERRTRSVRAG
jgi:hypothetical protein